MEFIKGMDISGLPEMLDLGAKFYDSHANERNIFELLKENGVNSIRLRIWNEPENIPESGGYSNLQHTINIAKQAKQYGMSIFLDFHYSDFWADPGKQVKPKAWENLSFDDLKQAVYNYTKNVLLKMQEEEVLPEMVQIGNEIRSGMLFPDGEVPNFPQLTALVNSGIHAVRDVAGENDIKVVIHLDQGGRYFYLRDWFDDAIQAGLDDFDIIGVSYYPFWHGTFAEFKETLQKMVQRYGKPIVVAETAHPWRCIEDGFVGEQQEKIAGFPSTPEAQRTVMELIMNITASLDEEMGIGIYYWEPVVIPIEGKGGWCSNMGFFNEKGIALPALESFQYERTNLKKDVAKIYQPDKIIAAVDNDIKLPDYVKVLFYDGTLKEIPVEWEPFSNQTIGNFSIDGRVSQIDQTVQLELIIVEKLENNHNYLINGGFENGMDGWSIVCEDERVKYELHPEFIIPFPAPPIYYLYVESPVNFKFSLTTKMNGINPGKYSLKMDYRGTNTTGVDVRMIAQTNDNNILETVIFPTDEEWTTYELSDIEIEDGNISIGINIVSPPVYGKIRQFTLTRID
ncbi:MAG: diguanylate cyclase domain [Anaerocolumna sp.]|nr:diguanylate cyclase domain [Anaerocolumna sp.]